MKFTEDIGKDYEKKFHSMVINPSRFAEAIATAKKINQNRVRYQIIEKATGVPWYLVGIFHVREASLDFSKFLGNGEPLNRATVNVPKHMGPFTGPDAFEKGAVAALVHEGFDKIKDWSLGSILFHMEEYNGEGYRLHGLPSPYVWAGSNNYNKEKYTSDGHLDPNLVDTQLGGAIMLSALIQLGILILNNTGVITMVENSLNQAVAIPAATTQAATAGVNVSKTTVATSVGQSIFGTIIATAAPMLAFLDPSTAHTIVGLVGGLGGLGVLISSMFGLLHLNSTASNNTLSTINSLSTMAQQAAIVLNNAVAQPKAATSFVQS